jgi:catechol 2,3-dioxygenase-like lactoylglutathione lyase family enzyme
MTLHMVELTVTDVARSVVWYRDVCRLTVELTDEPNGFALLTEHPPPANTKGVGDLPLKGGGEEGSSHRRGDPQNTTTLFTCPLVGEVSTSEARTGRGVESDRAPRLALKRGTPPATGGVRLHFLVADLTAELSRLAALGIHPESDLKTSPEGYRRAAFRDPDGYAVTLFEWVTSQLVPSRT